MGTPLPALVASILAIRLRAGRVLGILGATLSALTILLFIGGVLLHEFLVAPYESLYRQH